MTAVRYVITTRGAHERAVRAVDSLTVSEFGPWQVTIDRYNPTRTHAQNRTLWKWHGEVAAFLSQHTRRLWSPEDVHVYIFRAAFCPIESVCMVNGEQHSVPKGSSTLSTAEMSDAMTAYQAWALSEGVELTAPDEQP